MNRQALVVGNWKMEMSHKAAVDAATSLKKLLKQESLRCEVVVCPSFPALEGVKVALSSSQKIQVGAQNVHWEEKGPWTGEVSITQIKSLVSWCIIGHSERRQHFGETDEQVVAKLVVLLKHSVKAIVCVGETAQERADGHAASKVTQQVRLLFEKLNRASLSQVVIAYEPIWAIGTGQTPTPDEAAEIMLLIRKVAHEYFEAEGAQHLRIIYGGSITPETVEAFAAEPGIDGVLVGGASVRPLQLADIIERVGKAYVG